MDLLEIMKILKAKENPEALKGMTRFGINPNNNLGISVYILRDIAKRIGKNHPLALDLWNTEIHDARLLACFVDDPKLVTSNQMDAWAQDFDSWDICDQATTTLFDKTKYAWEKIEKWTSSDTEFVKRGAFTLLAGLAVHDKKACDQTFLRYSSLLKNHSTDSRNYVKKAISWAIRNIGKRNINLNSHMIDLANELHQMKSSSSRWIGRIALAELTSNKVKKRLKLKEKKEDIIG